MKGKKVTVKFLKEIRMLKGFKKQIDFANESGLHHSLISRYESGGRPDKVGVEKLKKALKLSVEEKKDFEKWLAGRERMVKKNGNGKKKKAVKKSRANGKHKILPVNKSTKIPKEKIGVKDADKLALFIGEMGGYISKDHAVGILQMFIDERKK